MRGKNLLIICVTVCVTLIICGILFWPTLYYYDKVKLGGTQWPIRTNRITGYTEIFYGEGWEPTEDQYKSIKAIRLDDSQNKLITGKAKITNLSSGNVFFADIYNGSDWTIKAIKVNIVAKEKDGSIRWKRSYNTYITGSIISPQTTGEILAKLTDADNIAFFDWDINEVMGYKGK